MEKTRSSQQSQITNLQTQVQSLELTIQNLGRYVAHLAERNIDLEIPSEIRRVLQQLDDLDRQRRKPLFTERKIGKSVSVNSHLGFPLKVLEELNEKEEHGSPQKTKKTPFFENTYEQLRQQRQNRYDNASSGGSGNEESNSSSPTRQIQKKKDKQEKSQTQTQPQQQQPLQRPNRLYDDNKGPNLQDMQTRLDELKLPEHVDRFMANIKSPLEVDSGVGTPMSPPSTSSNSSQSSSLSTGSLFSRMGYKNTPAVFSSPLTQRQTFTTTPTIITSPIKVITEVETKELNAKQELAMAMHPLSMVGEVNVKFNGTTQLKSIKPQHYLKSSITTTTATSTTLFQQQQSLNEKETDVATTTATTAVVAANATNNLAQPITGGNS